MIKSINNCYVKCGECNQKNLINIVDLNYDERYEMRSTGEETEHNFYGELCCDKCASCIKIDISVYEYPIGAISCSELICEGGDFIEEPRFIIEL